MNVYTVNKKKKIAYTYYKKLTIVQKSPLFFTKNVKIS